MALTKLAGWFGRRRQKSRTGGRPRRDVRPEIERLEGRCLLSYGVSKFDPTAWSNPNYPGQTVQITLQITPDSAQWRWDYEVLNISFRPPGDWFPPELGGAGTRAAGLSRFQFGMQTTLPPSTTFFYPSDWTVSYPVGGNVEWHVTSPATDLGLLPGQSAHFGYTTPPLSAVLGDDAGVGFTHVQLLNADGSTNHTMGSPPLLRGPVWVPAPPVPITLGQALPGGTRPDAGTCHCPCHCTDGGVVTMEPNTGTLSAYQPLDLNLGHPSSQDDGFGGSPGNPVASPEGGQEFFDGFGGEPALVYNSNTVNVQPIGEVHLGSGAAATGFQVRETWAQGDPQRWRSVAPASLAAGDMYLLGYQNSAVIGQTGAAPMLFDVQATTAGTYNTVHRYIVTATAMVVANDFSPFGPGWSLVGLSRLVVDPLGGYAMMAFGSGAPPRYFTGNGSGSFQSPPYDSGALGRNPDGTYTYTTKYQVRWNFDSSGLLRTVVDPHGLTVTYSYNGNSFLSSIAMPDGGVTTFNYTGGLLSSINEPGNRTLTLSHDPAGNLTGITDVDGTLRTYTYDGLHRLVNARWGPLSATYTYDPVTGVLTGVDRGLGTTFSIGARSAKALLSGRGVSQAVGTVTDGLYHTTTYTMDFRGRATRVQTADGAVQAWQRDAAGRVATYSDARNYATTYAYNLAGDLLQINYPDRSTRAYQYDPTFHQVTQYRDGLGHLTTFTYDHVRNTGDLLTITDALQGVTTLTWSGGLLQTVTDPLQHTTTYQYDPARRLRVLTDAEGNSTTYGYDAYGNPSTVTDALMHVTTSTYDPRNRLLTLTDAAGGLTILAYNAIGEVTSRTDPLGHLSTYTYDQRGWLTNVTEAIGTPQQRTATTAYDVAGNALTVTRPGNVVTSYGYDPVNRRTSTTEAVGTPAQRTTTVAYDLAGNVVSATDARGVTTTFAYDSLNRLTRVTEAASYPNTLPRLSSGSPVTTVAYDLQGNVLSATDADGVTTSFAYDALNRRTQVIEAWGKPEQRVTSIAYDGAGNVLSVTDPRGVTTSYAYDRDNRVTRVIEAYSYPSTLPALNHPSPVTAVAYDQVGNVQSVTDPRETATSFGYDQVNRRTQVIEGYGVSGLQRTTTTAYDLDGNVLSVTDPRGVTTSFAYDALNRRTRVIEAYSYPSTLPALNHASPVTTMAYDAGDNVVNVIDPLGQTTSYGYDALDRRTQTTDARGGVTAVAYDGADNVVSVTDPDHNVTSFVYDPLNRKVQQTDPLNHSSTFGYDPAGLLLSSTDRLGRRRSFVYDNLHRPKSETWTNAGGTTVQTLTYTYDAADNLLTAANRSGTYTFTYDPLNRRATQQAPFGTTLTFTYDIAGNRTQVQDNFGGQTGSVYDPLNRLVSRQFGGTGQTPLRVDLSYTPGDQVSGVTRSAAGGSGGWTSVGTTAYSYDALGRVVTLQHQNGSGGSLANYTYTYDVGSRLLTETLNGRTRNYSYDTTNQLTGDGTNTYRYDLNGNRTSAGSQPGPGNQLLSDSNWTYTYDNEGNLVGKVSRNSADTWTYAYDNRNHLTSAVEKSDGVHVSLTVTYTYDALGNRIQQDKWKASGGGVVTTRFAYDGPDVWADLTGTNALQTRYLRGDAMDQVFARIGANGAAAWYLTDRLGSVRDVTDAAGAVQDHIDYDGFGNVPTETNPAFGDRYKYTGREFDGDTGLQYNRARYYDPKTGRWTSGDPLEFAAGDSNLYRYVSNQSTNATDPGGLAFFGYTWQDIPIINYIPVGYWWWQESKEKRLGRELDEKLAQLQERRLNNQDWISQAGSVLTKTGDSSYLDCRENLFDPGLKQRWNHGVEDMKWLAEQGIYFEATAPLAVSARGLQLPQSVIQSRITSARFNRVVATVEDFNPRVYKIRAGDLGRAITATKNGINPEQAVGVAEMTNEELTAFRAADPISSCGARQGLSLTGGHHRTAEIIRRVNNGLLDPDTLVDILLHD
jgi:RHS repeat-associated protein